MSEYWITDDGTAIFADGDIGDVGHEGIVLDYLANSIADEVEYPSNGYQGVDHYSLVKYIYDAGIEDEINPKILATLEERYDARIFAVEEWGWSRMTDNEIETLQITPMTLKVIARGIEDTQEQFPENEFLVFSYKTKESEVYTLEELKQGGKNSMPNPGQAQIQRLNFGQTNIAKNQMADFDKEAMHPYYRNRPFPLADHYSFKEFMKSYGTFLSKHTRVV